MIDWHLRGRHPDPTSKSDLTSHSTISLRPTSEYSNTYSHVLEVWIRLDQELFRVLQIFQHHKGFVDQKMGLLGLRYLAARIQGDYNEQYCIVFPAPRPLCTAQGEQKPRHSQLDLPTCVT